MKPCAILKIRTEKKSFEESYIQICIFGLEYLPKGRHEVRRKTADNRIATTKQGHL